MIRIHNSFRPISRLENRNQPAASRKPAGLWWADGNGWADLVASPRGAAGRKSLGEIDYEVVLEDGFRLLVIDGMDAVNDLSRRFARPMPHAADGFYWQKGDRWSYDPGQDDHIESRGTSRAFLIDWASVAREWDGVEVTIPVGRERGDRIRVEWLDTDWDLPSGCAWRTDKVAVIEAPRPEPCEAPSP